MILAAGVMVTISVFVCSWFICEELKKIRRVLERRRF